MQKFQGVNNKNNTEINYNMVINNDTLNKLPTMMKICRHQHAKKYCEDFFDQMELQCCSSMRESIMKGF